MLYTKSSDRVKAIALFLGTTMTIGGLATGLASAQTAAPAASAGPAKQKLVITGLVDGYYSYVMSNPKGVGNGIVTGTPDYALRHATPTLSLAEVNLTYAPPAAGGFGYKATLVSGDTADSDVGNYPGGYGANTREARFANIQQLYATWAFAKGGGVDVGKFVTPFGYEVIESNGNYNYTRDIPFTNLLPAYHAGVRITSPVMAKGLTLSGYVVNSINDTGLEGVSDDNSSKGYIGVVNWADPAGKYTFVETYGDSKDKGVYTPYGSNGGNLSGNDETTLSDTDLTWNFDAKTLAGGSYTYREDKLAAAVGKVTSDSFALYLRRQLTGPTALAIRYSEDVTKDGTVVGSPSTKPQEITATYEIKAGANWLTRLEYRHDTVNVPSFLDSSGNITKKDQDMALVGVVYTFGG